MPTPKLPKGRTITSREEYMEIMGALELAAKRGEDMNTFLNHEYGITPIEYARAGMEWMSVNAQALALGQDENLQRILTHDMDARHEAYRKEHTPTYEQFQELEKKVNSGVNTATQVWTDAHTDLDFSIKEDEYTFTDAYQQILEDELKKYDLDTTTYTYIQEYWNNWVEEENIKRFNELFPTPESFRTLYYEIRELFDKPLQEIERAKYALYDTNPPDTAYDTFDDQQGILYKKWDAYLANKGFDINFWSWAGYYGLQNVLTSEEREAISADTFTPGE